MGEATDIFRLSGMKYPIHILAPTFSTVSLETNTSGICRKESPKKIDFIFGPANMGLLPF
jgi:hypothetical protein